LCKKKKGTNCAVGVGCKREMNLGGVRRLGYGRREGDPGNTFVGAQLGHRVSRGGFGKPNKRNLSGDGVNK